MGNTWWIDLPELVDMLKFIIEQSNDIIEYFTGDGNTTANKNGNTLFVHIRKKKKNWFDQVTFANVSDRKQ